MQRRGVPARAGHRVPFRGDHPGMAGPAPTLPAGPVALTDFGDTPAVQWDRAMRQYSTALHRYFAQRVNNPSDVADLVQKVFLRVIQRGANTPIDHVQHYLFQVASSVLNDELRRAQVRHEVAHDTYEEALHAPATELTPERVVLGEEALARVADILRRLPDLTRDVYLLRVHHEQEYRQIAKRLGICERGAQRHMARALQALESAMAADMPPEILAVPAVRKGGDHA